MDPSLFSASKTGRLVKITTDTGPDWAFVPDPLPASWEFDLTLWPLLNEAHKALVRLDAMARAVPNPTLLLKPLQKREAIRSSSLEGTYATAEELLLYELAPTDGKGDKDSDVKEVQNYDNALKFGTKNLIEEEKGIPLSRRLVQELHQTLLSNVRGDYSKAGQFRSDHVYVGSGHRFIPPPPDELSPCMHDLEKCLSNPDPRACYEVGEDRMSRESIRHANAK